MKTITIEDQEYEVPDWVNWVALDADGEWRGFEKKPRKDECFSRWTAMGGKHYFITRSVGWENSLREVGRDESRLETNH